ncbi:MAG: TetR/AcrR family transcriptional regulator [Burkholderiaceae bacterium]|nr:TetR/AcrR family transcriptional regulator [Burkholderiaceae bacterium]
MDGVPQPQSATRTTYRHGDLRRALIAAGVELARIGGPQAVVLREATRRAGVVPNAAYRHFESRLDLLAAVRSAAIAEVAVAMEKEFARAQRRMRASQVGNDADRIARASLRAVGVGYLRFAFHEPGLFRTAFASAAAAGDAPAGHARADPERAGASGRNPFQLLGDALDRYVDAGLLPAERRPAAEYLAWSAVHGLAMLALDGPLRGTATPVLRKLGDRVVEMVERGL